LEKMRHNYRYLVNKVSESKVVPVLK
jgi:hypothetical protein